MSKFVLSGFIVTVSVMALTGCPGLLGGQIPAVPIPLPEQTGKLSDLWKETAGGPSKAQELPLVPALPPTVAGILDIQYVKWPPIGFENGFAVPVGENLSKAGGAISKATVDLVANNSNPFPLKLWIFLAKDKPFEAKESIVELAASGTATSSIDLASLLSEKEVRVGLGISSPGASSKVTVDPNAPVTIKPTLMLYPKSPFGK